MKEISLCGGNGAGLSALVDDEDYDALVGYKWYYSHINKKADIWYVVRVEYLGKTDRGTNRNKNHYMHRDIMGCPAGFVDHKNGNTLDNRRENLRVGTQRQNNCNSRKKYRQDKASSDYIGVYYFKSRDKWVSQVAYNGQGYNLGYYDDEREAALNRDYFAKLLHGEFANLNFPDYDFSEMKPKRAKLAEQIRSAM